MYLRIAALIFALCTPLCAPAQQDESAPVPEDQEQPEEVVVIGQRYTLQLRIQMMEAEKKAYDTFNTFNDEKRFNISCSLQQPTGSHIESETQFCQPAFEREATRTHGQDYFENYRAYLDPYTDDHVPVLGPPQEAVIASQQSEYRRKMKQVAEEHPEFLEAIIQYSELRERYEEATSAERK